MLRTIQLTAYTDYYFYQRGTPPTYYDHKPPPICHDLYVIRHLPLSLTSLLFGPMICLEYSHMTSTNQSQSDAKFVT